MKALWFGMWMAMGCGSMAPLGNQQETGEIDADECGPDNDDDGVRACEDCEDADPDVRPGAPEVCDEIDNDCDELIDEGLGLPPDARETLRMLRELQRQAAEDSVPVVWGLADAFGPFASELEVSLRTREGRYLRAVASERQRLRADRDRANVDELFELIDWNGGDLEHGDLVSLRTWTGSFVLAEAGGGGAVSTGSLYHERERLFLVLKLQDAGIEGVPAVAQPIIGKRIRSNDFVALVASTGHFVAAEEGGGRELNANRETIGGWETFVVIFDDDPEQGPRGVFGGLPRSPRER